MKLTQSIVDDLARKTAGEVSAALCRSAILLPPDAVTVVFVEAARTAVAAASASVAVVGFGPFNFTEDKDAAHRVLAFTGLLLGHQNKRGKRHAVLDALDDLEALMAAGRVPRDDAFRSRILELFSVGAQEEATAG